MKVLSQNRSAALTVLWAVASALIAETGLPWHKKLFNKDDGGEEHANSGLANQLYAMDDGMDPLRAWRANRLPNLVAQVNSGKSNDNSLPKGNPNSKKENQKKSSPPPPPPPITRKNPDEAIHRRISQNPGDEPRRVAPRRLTPPVQPAADVLAVSDQTDDVTNRQWEKKRKVDDIVPSPVSLNVVDSTSGQQKRKLEKIDPKPSRRNDQQEGNQHTNQFKRTVADLLKSTKNAFKPAAGILDKHIDRPNDSNPAGQEVAPNRKALVRALLDSVNRSIVTIVEQYSRFTKTWAPNIERAINYIDFSKSNSLKWNNDDDANQRQEALLLLATGYEFMRVMIAWRQNMLTAHSAYRLYLETVLEEKEEDSQGVGENFAIQLEAVHSYISFKAWLLIHELTLESRLKLDYLAHRFEIDPSRQTKGSGGDFHRIHMELRESYEQKIAQFGHEQQVAIGIVSSVGELSSQFGEVDEFLNDYLDYSRENPSAEMKLPQRTVEFMDLLKSRINYNPALYERDFLIQLKETLEHAMEERYRYESTNNNSSP